MSRKIFDFSLFNNSSDPSMTEDFISSKNIRNYKDQKEIKIKSGMIITPTAKDIARELGIKVIYEGIHTKEKGVNKEDAANIYVDKSINQQQYPNYNIVNLEDRIERIVKEVVLSMQNQQKKNNPGVLMGCVMLMLNFQENRDTERSIIYNILENGFIIRDLHTYSTFGVRFIILVLEGQVSRDKCEEFINSLKKRFPVNILVS